MQNSTTQTGPKTTAPTRSRLETIVFYFITVAVFTPHIKTLAIVGKNAIYPYRFIPLSEEFSPAPLSPLPSGGRQGDHRFKSHVRLPLHHSALALVRYAASYGRDHHCSRSLARLSASAAIARPGIERALRWPAAGPLLYARTSAPPSVRPSVRRPVARERRMWRVRARAMAAAGEMGERVNTEEID